MTTPTSVTEIASAAVKRLADDCRQCYQCGQCTAVCPAGFDLEEGPRRVVRLILAEEVAALLDTTDVWRCNDCAACTEACPMEVPVRDMMAAVRDLQRSAGGATCAERAAADVATRRLARHTSIDNLSFGLAMVGRGYLPRDPAGAAQAAGKALDARRKALSDTSGVRAEHATTPDADRERRRSQSEALFYAGCSLPQDRVAYRSTLAVAAALDFPLVEVSEAGCCGHPSRGAVAARCAATAPLLTACPACDASLRAAGVSTTPLWEALVLHAERTGRTLTAAAPAFVPYVGCLSERGRALENFQRAAALAGIRLHLSYPALHAGCCGAVGGVYRGESEATRRLLGFAAECGAPIVTTCLLCRDNVRSAARRRGQATPVLFWPEFFRAGPPIDKGTSP